MELNQRKPDFNNLLRVLKCEVPTRPTLFELFMNMPLYERLTGRKVADESDLESLKILVDAFCAAGYDYVSTHACNMQFKSSDGRQIKTKSLNDGIMITDRASFEDYHFPNPEDYNYSRLEKIAPYLPEDMKLMVMGPGGVLENVIALAGYDNLCYMLYEEPELVQDLFDAVGSRLVKYYEIASKFDSVGVIMSNDDWGFNTQTFLSVEDMRKYVFPWHKKIVNVAHGSGIPAILHSCGYMGDVMDDIITNMCYDGKHSYEDNILPVEKSYERWGGQIAIMGGIDLDFLIRSSTEEIKARCENMLKLASKKGGYALGSGNSIPEYIPYEKYMAMITTA